MTNNNKELIIMVAKKVGKRIGIGFLYLIVITLCGSGLGIALMSLYAESVAFVVLGLLMFFFSLVLFYIFGRTIDKKWK